MVKIMYTVIIADDLTGANDTGAALAKNGLSIATLDVVENLDQYNKYDGLAFHTDSRGMKKDDAYNIVNNTCKKVLESGLTPSFFSKRCDSTLRGNIGSEIDAILDALPHGTIAMMAPAWPNASKILIGDFLLVNGTPVEKTDVRNDPTSPVTTSRVSAIVRKQSKYPVAVISLETILEGVDSIESNIKVLVENGARIIVFDTSTDDDLKLIAKAVVNTQLPFVTVDPGAFTNAVAMEYVPHEVTKAKQKSLFVIGTASGIIVDQIADLRASVSPYVVKIDTVKLIEDKDRQKEIQRVTSQVCDHITENQTFVVATMIENEDKIDLNSLQEKFNLEVKDISERISDGVSEIGLQILKNSHDEFGGLYASGGDISKGLLHKIGSKGVAVKDEIIPLTVYGRIIGGLMDNKPLVTKGGLIGDKKTLSLCADYLNTKISSSFYESEGE